MANACFYCDQKMWKPNGTSRASVKERFGITSKRLLQYRKQTDEHLVRRADGGKRKGNIVKACLICNSLRGEASPEDHKAAMQMLVRMGMHPNVAKKTWKTVLKELSA